MMRVKRRRMMKRQERMMMEMMITVTCSLTRAVRMRTIRALRKRRSVLKQWSARSRGEPHRKPQKQNCRTHSQVTLLHSHMIMSETTS